LVLAELDIRHTRRHMSTRRVALGDCMLPTDGNAYGAVLLAAVIAMNVPGLDEEQSEALGPLLVDAADGLRVPKRALRFRLQTDTEGLAQSKHRLLGVEGQLVFEHDVHALYPGPQVLGAVMAAASMPAYPRRLALDAIDRALHRLNVLPEGIAMKLLTDFRQGPRPEVRLNGATNGATNANGHGPRRARVADRWLGVPSECRWAMEVLGFDPGPLPNRTEVQGSFRRLVREAHPDHGGAAVGAAARLDELGEARRVLLGALAVR
jgi:hypothetical protein